MKNIYELISRHNILSAIPLIIVCAVVLVMSIAVENQVIVNEVINEVKVTETIYVNGSCDKNNELVWRNFE